MSIPRHADSYRLEDFGDEVVLYNLETTRVVYLNDSASLIWRLCDGQRSIADLKSLLRETYPQMTARIEHDVRAALRQFRECGAIELRTNSQE